MLYKQIYLISKARKYLCKIWKYFVKWDDMLLMSPEYCLLIFMRTKLYDIWIVADKCDLWKKVEHSLKIQYFEKLFSTNIYEDRRCYLGANITFGWYNNFIAFDLSKVFHSSQKPTNSPQIESGMSVFLRIIISLPAGWNIQPFTINGLRTTEKIWIVQDPIQ